MDKATKEMVVGGVAGAVTDTVIDFPIAQLFGGKIPSIQIKDAQGYFFGVGAGDAVTATSGLALYLYGRRRNQQVENIGKGWLLAWGLLKGAEVLNAIYIRLRIMFPIQDWNLLQPQTGASVATTGVPRLMVNSSPIESQNRTLVTPTVSKPELQADMLFV